MSKSKTRLQKSRINTPLMQSACINYGVKYTEFNSNSYRLEKDGFVTVDYYPTSNKCFFHDVKEWGEVTNVREFIKFQFNPK